MKVSEIWAQYQGYTKDLSDQSRKLAFALGAICWFFKTEDATFPKLILLSLAAIITFLVLDIVQNLVALLRRSTFARNQEEERWSRKENWDDIDTNDFEVELPASLDRPVFRLFIAKLFALAVAAGFLIAEFAIRLK